MIGALGPMFVLGIAIGPGAGFSWPGAAEIDAADLSSADPALRLRAVERAGRSGDPSADARLRPLLADPVPSVRGAAARLLARRGDPEAITAAVHWLGSPAGTQRAAGIEALRDAPELPAAARAATERAVGDGELGVRLLALDVIARHQPVASFAAVATAADDDTPPVRMRAIRLLDEMGDRRAVLPLIGRLGDPDRPVRVEAARVLGALGDTRAAPALVRALTDGPDDVRIAAADALGALRARAATAALAALARRRPSDELARHARLALGTIASPEAIAVLVSILRESPGDELEAAFQLGGAAAVDALVADLAGPRPGPTASLLGVLGDRRATAPLAAMVARGGAGGDRALAALARLRDPDALPVLAHAASSPAVDTRRIAWQGLEALADDRGAVALAAGLGDGDAVVRRRAAVAAGRIGGPGTAALLASRLLDPDADVRRAAARSLGRLGAGEATPSLIAALGRRGDDAGLGVALEATARFEHAPALAAAAERTTAGARLAALRGLATAVADGGDASSVAGLLLSIVREGGPGAGPAADALAGVAWTPARLPGLLRAFDEAEPPVRARLCAALGAATAGAVGTAAAVLARLIADPSEPAFVRAAAAWAAGSLPGRLLRPQLDGAATDAIVAVAESAAAALAMGAPRPRARGGWLGVRLRAPDGTPLSGVMVRVSLPGDHAVWVLAGTTGDVRVLGLPPGAYEVAAPGYTLGER